MNNILFLIIMIMDLIIPYFIAIPYKGYSHSKMVMSILGCKNSLLGTIYNFWMIISGIGICLLGYNVFLYYSNENFVLSITVFILILLYGVCDAIISGIFPLNEKKEDITFSSKIHGIGSVIGFLALQFAPMFIAILEFKRGELLLGHILSVFFILSLISLIFFVIGEKPKFKNTVFALEGLWQRVLCLFMYAPLIVWIIHQNSNLFYT